MAFKEAPRNNNGIKKVQEDRFIEQARGETIYEKQKIDKKGFNVLLPIETINLLREYQRTEAKKIESQAYIVNEAILLWLKSKGFIGE